MATATRRRSRTSRCSRSSRSRCFGRRLGLVFDDAEVRGRVVTTVFDNAPLAREADRDRLERTVDDALEGAGRLGPASILLLIVAASGVMGALRHAINEAWTSTPARRCSVAKRSTSRSSSAARSCWRCRSRSTRHPPARRRARERAEGDVDRRLVVDTVGDGLPFVFRASWCCS